MNIRLSVVAILWVSLAAYVGADTPIFRESQKNILYITFCEKYWRIAIGHGMTSQIGGLEIRGANYTDEDLFNTLPATRDLEAKQRFFDVEKKHIREEWKRLGFDVNPLEFSRVRFIGGISYHLSKPKEETFSITKEGFLKMSGVCFFWKADRIVMTEQTYDFVYDDERKVWLNVTDGLNEAMPIPVGMKEVDWIGYVIDRKNECSGINNPTPPGYDPERARSILEEARKGLVPWNPSSAACERIGRREEPKSQTMYHWLAGGFLLLAVLGIFLRLKLFSYTR